MSPLLHRVHHFSVDRPKNRVDDKEEKQLSADELVQRSFPFKEKSCEAACCGRGHIPLVWDCHLWVLSNFFRIVQNLLSLFLPCSFNEILLLMWIFCKYRFFKALPSRLFSKSQPFTATSSVNARSSINRRLNTKIQEKWASCPQCQTGGHLPHNKKPSPPARLKTEACPHNDLPDLKITNHPQDLQTSRCTLLRPLLLWSVLCLSAGLLSDKQLSLFQTLKLHLN